MPNLFEKIDHIYQASIPTQETTFKYLTATTATETKTATTTTTTTTTSTTATTATTQTLYCEVHPVFIFFVIFCTFCLCVNVCSIFYCIFMRRRQLAPRVTLRENVEENLTPLNREETFYRTAPSSKVTVQPISIRNSHVSAGSVLYRPCQMKYSETFILS
jgi:hypothetical protein